MIFNPLGKDDCLMLDSKVIYRYLHAGKGVVTLAHPTTWKAHSYAFLYPKNSKEFPEGTIFVYVLHEGHKLYLGMLDGSNFRTTSRSKFTEDTESVRGARYIVSMANKQCLVDRREMNLYHSGKCCKCGRSLTAGSSMTQGIGKKCLRKYIEIANKVQWDGN